MIRWELLVLVVALPITGTVVGEMVRRRGKKFYLLILPAAALWATVLVRML